MDVFALVAAERRRLAEELGTVSDEEWRTPSLCGAWSAHEVAAHLVVPFTASLPTIALAMVRSFGNFDRANDRLARDLAAALAPAECVERLEANAEHRFTPPGFGPEAPLTDTITHAGDILRPLGRTFEPAPEAIEVALAFASKRRTGFATVDATGLRFAAVPSAPGTAAVAVGEGEAVVSGPGLSLVGTLLGRTAYLEDLTGDGADLLRTRALAAARR